MYFFWSLWIVAQCVHAHGYLSQPQAQFYDNTKKTSYEMTIDERSDNSFRGLKWNDSPDNNLKTFTPAFNRSRFTSLKDMFDKSGVTCGNSRTDVAPLDANGMTSMKWQNDEYREGFVNSHSGPCEAWINNTRVFQNDDCRSAYPSYPATIPIDYSSCGSGCIFEFYWLALHEPAWQAYKQCVRLKTSQTITKRTTTVENNATVVVNYSLSNKKCTCSII